MPPELARALGESLALAVCGALGNVADRLLLGAVRDYIDLHWSGLHWPSFNLADMAVVTGLALVVLFSEDAGERRGKSSRASHYDELGPASPEAA